MRLLSAIIILLCSVMSMPSDAGAQSRIFHPSFHTLQVQNVADNMSAPIMRLGSSDRIEISFDELAEDRRYLRCELIHCDADWRPDALVASEYLNGGFNESSIDDYAYSRATTVHYVNYRITIPNQELEPTKSGNYLLRVYDESEPDETLLTAAFRVIEPVAPTEAMVTTRTDIDRNRSHQQLSLSVDLREAGVSSPSTDIRVDILQNSRTDNAVTLTRPSSVSGTKAIYEHRPELIFDAGNEYRRFETVSTRFAGMGVDSYTFASPLYHATLKTDLPRSEAPYAYDVTQHGRYLVRTADSTEPRNEADYIMTHFTLDMPEIKGAEIYLDGDLALRRFDTDNRMVFNPATGLYECAMLLKQGAYNYNYLTVPYGTRKGQTSTVEGDFHDTANEYLILVYHIPPGSRHQRLIGATTVVAGR